MKKTDINLQFFEIATSQRAKSIIFTTYLVGLILFTRATRIKQKDMVDVEIPVDMGCACKLSNV